MEDNTDMSQIESVNDSTIRQSMIEPLACQCLTANDDITTQEASYISLIHDVLGWDNDIQPSPVD